MRCELICEDGRVLDAPIISSTTTEETTPWCESKLQHTKAVLEAKEEALVVGARLYDGKVLRSQHIFKWSHRLYPEDEMIVNFNHEYKDYRKKR